MYFCTGHAQLVDASTVSHVLNVLLQWDMLLVTGLQVHVTAKVLLNFAQAGQIACTVVLGTIPCLLGTESS